jgi:DNA-binding transcriptional ArsR family regulator
LKSAKQIHWLKGPESLNILVSPVRLNIMDRIEALAPCTIGELARSLRVPPDRLYYHVELLVKAGLLIKNGQRPGPTRHGAIYALRARHWHIDYRLHEARSRKQLGRITDMMLRQAARDFRQGLRMRGTRTKGANRNLWSLRLESHLSDAQVRAINTHLQAILEVLRHRGTNPRARLHALSWVIAPLPERN